MKRSVLSCLLAFAALACTEESPPPGDGTTSTKITLQVSGEPEETRVYTSLVEEFQKEHPDISVNLVEIAEKDDHLAKLATSFAGRTPPDLFLVNYREYAQFVARGAIEPIGDLLADRGIDLADYYEPPVQAFTYEGALQCMPQNVSSLAVYYNKKLFQQAGIDPPHGGWTWDEFRATAIALTAGDVDGLGLDPEIIRVAPFVWSNGGEITDDPEAPTRFTLDEPAARDALEFIISLVRDDRVVPTETEIAAQDSETRFINGKL
ncbi:MAG: sugar ABC transporter substrate-binding protein, partial [Actinobacteria bacterium]|nr:sugar ABC transporter substrate-binding protein [Actinomycetota bacterium]